MLNPIRKYADFSGRSPRSEFWLFVLAVLLISTVLTYMDAALGLGGSVSREWVSGNAWVYAGTEWTGGWLTRIFALAMIIPLLAVSVRRLHDANHHGAWLLLLLVPGLGWLVLLIFHLQRSWPLPNAWGEYHQDRSRLS